MTYKATHIHLSNDGVHKLTARLVETFNKEVLDSPCAADNAKLFVEDFGSDPLLVIEVAAANGVLQFPIDINEHTNIIAAIAGVKSENIHGETYRIQGYEKYPNQNRISNLSLQAIR